MASLTSLPFDYGQGAIYGNHVYYWSAPGTAFAFGFRPWENETESEISLYLSVVGTSPTYRIGIQADSGGSPSGVWIASGTVTPGVTGWHTASTGSYSVTQGIKYWVVFQHESGTLNGSNYAGIYRLGQHGVVSTEKRWPVNLVDADFTTKMYNTAAWVDWEYGVPIFMLGDGMGQPYHITAISYIRGSIVYGENIKLDTTKVIRGFSMYLYKNGSPEDDLYYKVYNSADSVVASGTFTQASKLGSSPTSPTKVGVVFSSPITIPANTRYRLVLESPGSTLANAYTNVGFDSGSDTDRHTQTYARDSDVYIALSTNAGSSWLTSDVHKGYDYLFDLEVVKYWVGGAGNWNDSAHWSLTSGGTGGAGAPSSSESAVIDGNSGSNFTISITGAVSINSLVEDNATGAILQTSTYVLTLSGSLVVETLEIIDIGDRYNLNLTGNGTITIPDLYTGINIITSGTYTLGGDITGSTSTYSKIRVASGTFNTANYDITDINQFVTSSSASKTLNLGSSVITLKPYNTSGSSAVLDTSTTGTTLNAGTSKIIFDTTASVNQTFFFGGGGKTFYDFQVIGSNSSLIGADIQIYGNNSFHDVSLDALGVVIYKFASGSTQTATQFLGTGNPSNKAELQPLDAGTFSLSQASGSAVFINFNVIKSVATGGASFFAVTSDDGGDNSGWTFGEPVYYRSEGSNNTGEGLAVLEFASFTMETGSDNTSSSNAIYVTTFAALPQKDYEYRVFTKDDEFIGVWQDVTSDFSYSQAINQNATELTVDIARSPDNLIVKLEPLLDSSGNQILDQNSNIIYVQTETANSVGEGSDVDLNYNVDVYAFYGGYEQLLDAGGEPILDNDSDPILVQYGSPNGKRVYSGYIADYDLIYGEQTGVQVIIVPHATEMDHYVFKDGVDTTVSFLSQDPVTMARAAMDNYISQGGRINYDAESMPLSGESISYDFKLQTTRESIDKSIDLLPSGYYHFVDVGEAKQYLLEKETEAEHTFWYEKHITELRLRKSITQLVNDVYFVGGDTGTEDLFTHSVDVASRTNIRPGLDRKSDSRVTLYDSAIALSEQEIEQYKTPRYRTSVTITDAVYDIESIKLGEMVGFKNFGTFVDNLVLQIVNLKRSKHSVTLDLDMIVPNDTKRLYELKKELLAEQIRGIGDAPS